MGGKILTLVLVRHWWGYKPDEGLASTGICAGLCQKQTNKQTNSVIVLKRNANIVCQISVNMLYMSGVNEVCVNKWYNINTVCQWQVNSTLWPEAWEIVCSFFKNPWSIGKRNRQKTAITSLLIYVYVHMVYYDINSNYVWEYR